MKEKKRLGTAAILAVCLGVWGVSVAAFWILQAAGVEDAMGYSILFLWLILPAAVLVGSYLIGRRNDWGRAKWTLVPVFGILYMAAEYLTFSLANMLAFHKVNPPDPGMLLAGAVLSLAAMATGHLLYRRSLKEP